MKRRSFLGLFGAAVSAPAMPQVAAGQVGARAAAYGPATMAAAVAHAKSRAVFSVWGLAKAVNISMEQAETLMGDMARRGILGPLQGTTFGGRWASSKIMATETIAKAQSLRAVRKVAGADTNSQRVGEVPVPDTDEERAQGETFTQLSGVAAPMPLVNIDTDMILPKQYLKTVERTGLGAHLFDELRYDRNGNELPDFVLNKPQYRDAKILVAGHNFGCGSSREHAPWAIKDFGIRCIIAPSFADIFFNNCFKNGILPIVLPQEQVDVLMEDAERGANARIEIDLAAQTVTASDGTVFSFQVDMFSKHCLLNGLDDIGITLEKSDAIDAFEAQTAQDRPWA